ncbi:MAG: hypothetical protein JXR03_20955 [Cyclobacteriaceae bacterium]
MRNVNIWQHKLSILLVYTIILGIISLTFSSCSTHRAVRLRNKSIKEWSAFQLEEVKKSPEGKGEKWTIYSRKIKGTNFLEYKIVGDIEASPKACIAAFRQDILNQAADLENKKYPTYEIVSESGDSLLTYVIHNEPFPLKDTEMSVMYIFSNDEDSTTGVTWHEAWDESQAQISKKLNRVETFRGSWVFALTSDNSWQGANSVQFDPKGMPMWLVKPMVMKFLKNGLEDIKGATSK